MTSDKNPLAEVFPPQAFEALRLHIEAELSAIDAEGSLAFASGNHAAVARALDRASAVRKLQEQLGALRTAWHELLVPAKAEEKVTPAHREPAGERAMPAAEGGRTRSVLNELNHGRVARDRRTPNAEFCRPILEVLIELGGSGKVATVLDRVGKKMSHILRPIDHQPTPMTPGIERWRNGAQWARLQMVKEGLLRKGGRHGIWEITDRARAELADPPWSGHQ